MRISLRPSEYTRAWGYAACAWCALFAMLHIYWAVGGEMGLASSAGPGLAARRPVAFVLLGLWGVALMLLVGAAFSVSLARWRPDGDLRRGMAIVGWLVGTVLLVRGLLLEFILLTGVGGVASSIGSVELRWSLILWNPWFALGGLALILATRQFQRT